MLHIFKFNTNSAKTTLRTRSSNFFVSLSVFSFSLLLFEANLSFHFGRYFSYTYVCVYIYVRLYTHILYGWLLRHWHFSAAQFSTLNLFVVVSVRVAIVNRYHLHNACIHSHDDPLHICLLSNYQFNWNKTSKYKINYQWIAKCIELERLAGMRESACLWWLFFFLDVVSDFVCLFMWNEMPATIHQTLPGVIALYMTNTLFLLVQILCLFSIFCICVYVYAKNIGSDDAKTAEIRQWNEG